MVEGYKCEEVKLFIERGKWRVKDLVVGKWEGEILFYHKEHNKESIEIYRDRILLDLEEKETTNNNDINM